MHRGSLDPGIILSVVNDGAISSPLYGDGRFFPVLIVDCSRRSDILDLIHLHASCGAGDVTAIWWKHWFKQDSVYLELRFTKPVETRAAIGFPLATKGDVVEWIRRVRGLYLQPLSAGQTVSEGIDKEKILVEVPASATLPGWDKMYERSLLKKYMKLGLKKSGAVQAVAAHRKQCTGLWFGRSSG